MAKASTKRDPTPNSIIKWRDSREHQHLQRMAKCLPEIKGLIKKYGIKTVRMCLTTTFSVKQLRSMAKHSWEYGWKRSWGKTR
jgi:hypothetical protein